MPKKAETIRRIERGREKMDYEPIIVVWINLNGIYIELTPFASAGLIHTKFMSVFGRTRWHAFNFPINGRCTEVEKIMGEADYVIIYGDEGCEELNKPEEKKVINIIARAQKHNRKLKIYTNSQEWQTMNTDAIKFTDVKSLITIIKPKKR